MDQTIKRIAQTLVGINFDDLSQAETTIFKILENQGILTTDENDEIEWKRPYY